MDILKQHIRTVLNFPRAGIDFKDITPLLANPPAYRAAIDRLTQLVHIYAPDVIAAIDARGFLFGSVAAYNLQMGLYPLRKKGKLPVVDHSHEYELEYAGATLEMSDHGLAGKRVVIVDDVLATGGTVNAAATVIRQANGVPLGSVFLIDLSYLAPERRDKYPLLPPHKAVMTYATR